MSVWSTEKSNFRLSSSVVTFEIYIYGSVLKLEVIVQDFNLTLPCSWGLRFSGMLR
jgi:hypothetical protein